MAVGDTWTAQASFAAGAFPQNEQIPPNGAEDIVDGLIDDDGAITRRGGTAYKTTSNTANELIALWDGFLVPGPRTILQDTGAVYVLALDDITPAQLLSGVSTRVGRWTC
jgi:hypothetical protein